MPEPTDTHEVTLHPTPCPNLAGDISTRGIDEWEPFATVDCWAKYPGTGKLDCARLTIASLRTQLEAQALRPGPPCATCGESLDQLLAPGTGDPYNGKIGYRCTDCERLFCASCIKGQAHVNSWAAPCNDEELQRWAKAVADEPTLRATVRELEAQLAEAKALGEAERAVVVAALEWNEGVPLDDDHQLDFSANDRLAAAVDALLALRGKPTP